jgi:hypothetical protein
LPAMPARWSADSVLALAPDDASRRAAIPLGRPGQWTDAGAAGDLVWGLCAGSGKNPYQVIADLAGPAFKCSCPSRKFPCKHTLALLLLWSAGTVADQSEPSDYARTWQEARQAKTQKSKSSSRTEAAEPAAAHGTQAVAGEAAGSGAADRKDEAASTRRAAERAGRVADGLADLREWLRDQVRAGLASTGSLGTGPAGAGPGGPGPGGADLMAARMVDAQAPGVAAALRGLAGATSGGSAGRLLSEYALLHLLITAHQRLDELPDGLAAVVRSRVGYPVSRDDVLGLPAVTDHWLVLGARELTDAQVPGRRIWLRGRQTKRWAMLLTYAAPNGAWQDPGTARLRPGEEIHADLHYYPGQPPLRALIGTRRADPVLAGPPVPDDSIDAIFGQWSGALKKDPWLITWPALLCGTPVPPGSGRPDAGGSLGAGAVGRAAQTWNGRTAGGTENPWYLVDATGASVPVADRESLWTLLAVSGGHPVTVAGEWHPDGLVALTTWHADQAVTL